MKTNSLSLLPPGFLSMYYRSQNDYVKENVRKALGAFVNLKLNSGKELEAQKKTNP